MSYEQPDWHESAEATHPGYSHFSFSTRKSSHDPRPRDVPLSTLRDVDDYVRNTSYGNMGRISREPTSAERTHLGYKRNENLYSEGRSRAKIVTAFGDGENGSIRLEGKTEAFFDGSSFKTAGVKVQEAESCSCTEDKCIRARGKLNARYSVRTQVTLPKVSDYPVLSPSQKKRLQTTINTILAPHEQKHVAAFRKYNGTTSRPFDLTICKGEFDSAIQSMFDVEESARREAAQEESDALDPFFFEFEL